MVYRLKDVEPDTPKIQKRRKDIDLLEEDIREVKNALYTELYSKSGRGRRTGLEAFGVLNIRQILIIHISIF